MADPAQQVASAPDPTARIAPALSATSDAPKVETPAAEPEKAPAAEVETPEVKPVDGETEGEDEVTETETGEGESEAKEAKDGKEIPAYAKREITRQRNKRREADARAVAAETKAAEAAANLKKTLELVEKLTGENAVVARKANETEDPRPKREAFDNPDAYDSALVEWAGRTAASAATAAVEARAEADRAKDKTAKENAETEARNRETVEAFAKRKDAFIEEHPDYADVAESDDLKISVPMASVIMHDEDGPAIAYYLGQNPDEAERISKLSPARVGAELGRIAARLNAKPVVSTKPAPIKPIKTGSAPAVCKSANEESMEEYAARRQTEMRSGSNGMATSH